MKTQNRNVLNLNYRIEIYLKDMSKFIFMIANKLIKYILFNNN